MSAFDLVVTIALGSTLATILLSKEVALADGVLALGLLVGLQYGLAFMAARILSRQMSRREIPRHRTPFRRRSEVAEPRRSVLLLRVQRHRQRHDLWTAWPRPLSSGGCSSPLFIQRSWRPNAGPLHSS